MTIQDLYDQLFFSELRHVYLNSLGAVEILDEHKREIAILIQAVLREMYSEIPLSFGRVKLNLTDGVKEYSITPENTALEHVRGARVSELIKIVRLSSEGNTELLEGDWKDERSFLLTNYRVIQIPEAYLLDSVLIDYQAGHPKLDIELCVFNPSSVWIDLPDSFAPILCLGVASRKLNTTGLDRNKQEGIKYFTMYRQALAEMVSKNKGIPNPSLVSLDYRDKGYL